MCPAWTQSDRGKLSLAGPSALGMPRLRARQAAGQGTLRLQGHQTLTSSLTALMAEGNTPGAGRDTCTTSLAPRTGRNPSVQQRPRSEARPGPGPAHRCQWRQETHPPRPGGWDEGRAVWCAAGTPCPPKASLAAPAHPPQAAPAHGHSGFRRELHSKATATCHQRWHDPITPTCLVAQLHTLWASAWTSDRQRTKPRTWQTRGAREPAPDTHRAPGCDGAGTAMAQRRAAEH